MTASTPRTFGMRYCERHQGLRPEEGGCSIGPGKWICGQCWLAHPLLTGKNKRPR